jgi:tetratricopeptide (TPR) repeat protein
MTPTPGRNRRLLLSGLLLTAVVTACGAIVYFARSRDAPPVPPDVEADESEPAVAAAIRVARRRVLDDPRSAQAWGDLGEAFLANEMEEPSQVCFAQAERLNPGDPRWPYLYGVPLMSQGDRAGALPYQRRAAELSDSAAETNTAPRLLLAENLLALGQTDEAEEQFRRVLARRPDDVRAQFGMGLLAYAREDWPASRDHLLRCLTSPQARQKASALLSAVSQRLGDTAGADRYRAQADRFPKDFDWADPYATEYLNWAAKKRARYRLVEQLEAAGRLADAVAVLRPMATEFPDDHLAQFTLGKYLGQLGDYAGAERALRRALELAPDKAQAHYYLSLVLMKEGEALLRQGEADPARAALREAGEEARQALAITPDNGFAHMSLGLTLKYLGDRPGAIAALRRAVGCNPELAELQFYLGELLADDGQGAEARRYLRQALDLAPAGAPWRQAALARLGALKE